jgi:hypothetical protein
MQGTRSAVCEFWVTWGDCARNRTNPSRVLMRVTHRGRAKSVPEPLDDPTFCHAGTLYGF